MVDIDHPLTAVGDKLFVSPDRAELMLLPFAALRAWVFVPVGAAQQIGEAVAIHIDHGDAFGMIVPETMREESQARLATRTIARLLHALLGRMSGVLGLPRGREKEQRCDYAPKVS